MKSINRLKFIVTFFVFSSLINNQFLQAQVMDYGYQKNWIALPQTKDAADFVPFKSDFNDGQDSARTDVFYIHPTTLYKKRHNNDNLRIPSSKRITKVVVLNQATVFNGSCRVYAPKYRQASLSVQLQKDSLEKNAALDFAYSDVKKAFEYYLEKYNSGRPIIIAGHSQGSYHAIRLLSDYFEGKPLMKQLVVAYIGGHAVTKMQTDSMFQTIPYSQSSLQTGCIVSWQTIGENAYADYFRNDATIYLNGQNIAVIGQQRLCTNPVSWDTSFALISKDLHLGSVKMSSGKRTLRIVMPNYLETNIVDGFVVISKPKGTMFNAPGKNYHIYDYNLFYLNIRQNVSERVDAYFKKTD